jgi:hypothetical protein
MATRRGSATTRRRGRVRLPGRFPAAQLSSKMGARARGLRRTLSPTSCRRGGSEVEPGSVVSHLNRVGLRVVAGSGRRLMLYPEIANVSGGD